jgi:hypothetical protein
MTFVARDNTQGENFQQYALSLFLEGSRPDAVGEAREPLQGKANYLIGDDPALWRRDVPLYGRVLFQDVYAGIDMVYYGTQERLEYDFIIEPGAEPGQIAWRVSGADAVDITSEGHLELKIRGGAVQLRAPRVYQERDGAQVKIAGRYRLDSERVSFELGAYDSTLPLIIDPVVEYASLAGVPGGDARGVGVDGQGNMYITGHTSTSRIGLPGAHMKTELSGESDIFVVKFNPAGDQVLYATYIGGSGKESGKCMYVDQVGNVYIGGNTTSKDLPTQGSIAHYGRTYDLLVVKVNPDGDGLAYCCVFGGEGMEEFRGITVDAAGNCIAVGGSHSPDMITTPGSHQPVYNDPSEDTPEVAGSFTKGEDAIIAKINPDGTDFVFLTWLGGHGFEKAWAVAVDSKGDLYVAGHVEALDFPVTADSYQQTHAGGTPRKLDQYGPKDAFVAKLSGDGEQVLAATYFGGSGQDVGYGVGVDDAGNVYLAGNTYSSDLPVSKSESGGAAGGDQDVFVAKFSPDLTKILYSRYFGGSGKDALASDGMVVDRTGHAYVVGLVGPSAFGTPGAFVSAYLGGVSDGFFARFESDGRLDYATLLGGSGEDDCSDVALDGRGGVYISGKSGSGDFRSLKPYPLPVGTGRDVFLARLRF